MLKPILLTVLTAVSFHAHANTSSDASCYSLQKRVRHLEKQVINLEARELLKKQDVLPTDAIACKALDTRNAAIGTKCYTTRGALYERVEQTTFNAAWKGPDGLLWGDHLGKASQKAAASLCINNFKSLPTIADFERGEAYGFREVLRDFDTYNLPRERPTYYDPRGAVRWYWTATQWPCDKTFAYEFVAVNSNPIASFHAPKEKTNSVRCVSR